MKNFPVMIPYRLPREIQREDVYARCPREVPWSFVEPHEAQALENHQQTLARLAVRGGLGPDELVAVLEDRRWRAMDECEAVNRLVELAVQAARKEAPVGKGVNMDTLNRFGVGVHGENVVFLKPVPLQITREQALNLAAYLVALADRDGEFDKVLQAIRNT